jgi:putative MATE family efflux protein
VVIAEGVKYLQFACVSYLSLTINLAISTMLRCTEQVKIPMITSGFCAGFNALLNYVFIFGAFGMPAMGIAGAGLATAISALLNPILMMIISAARKTIVIAPLKQVFALKGFYKPFWGRALPVLLNELFWSIAIIAVNMVFGRMGTDNYAALTVVRTIEGLVFVFFVGICNACNILVGKCIGAGEIERSKSYSRRFMLLTPLIGIAAGLVIIALRYPLIGLFDLSEAAKQTARTLLVIFAIDAVVRYIPYVEVVGIFRAGGETRMGLITDVVCHYLFILPAVILAGLVFRLPFVTSYIIMLVVDDVSKLIITIPYYRSMRWIKPIVQPQREDREAAIVECGSEPVL